MKIGVYTAILHDRPLAEALEVIRGLGLNGAEINSGGFLPPVHLPIDSILTSDVARDEYLAEFSSRSIKLTALNCNGNPLHPDRQVGEAQGNDVFNSIKVAARLGVKRVITMSGLPASEPGANRPSWVVNPWNSVDLDTMDYQWNEIAVPFWKRVNDFAVEHDVKVALEMHPQNIVFNPSTLVRLVERTNATHIGAEMDPSHLFWQQIDPIEATKYLGELVFCAAAKDVRINPAVAIHGVLDDRFTRVEHNPVSLGGKYTLAAWPKDSAWDFVALGLGHSQDFWNRFVSSINKHSPETDIAIEHEDASLGRLEGLEASASVLLSAHEQLEK